MKWLVLLWLLPAPCRAQDALQSKVINSHAGGLVTYYSGQRLNDDQLQYICNGVFDKDLGVVKRNGYTQYGSAVCTKNIRFGVPFRNANLLDYFIVQCDTQTYYTTGDGNFTVLGATSSATQRLRSTQALGKRWFTNGVDTPWSWDGTANGTQVSSVTAAPLAQLVGSFKSRLVFANYPGAQSTVLLSGYQSGSDYTIPAVQTDTSPVQFPLNGPNDGRAVKCLFDGFKDVLILWNEDQMYGLYGNGVNSFIVRQLSQQIGCIEQESVQEHDGKLRWLSKQGMYEYNGSQLKRVSDPVKDLMDRIVGTESNVTTLVQTSQSDWQAGDTLGAGAGAPMSTSISPGNVVPDTWTVTDSAGTDWQLGTMTNVSTKAADGYLTFQISTFQFVNGRFENGDFTNWTQSGMTAASPSIGISPCAVSGAAKVDLTAGAAYPTSCVSTSHTPTYTLYALNSADVAVKQCTITPTISAGGSISSVASTCDIKESASGSNIGIFGLDISTFTHMTLKLKFVDDQGNYLISIATTVANRMSIHLGHENCDGTHFRSQLTACSDRDYEKTATFVSRIFDTTYSTPTWGFFQSTVTYASADITYTVKTQVSADGVIWDSLFDTVSDQKIRSGQKRKIRYQVDATHVTNGGLYYGTATFRTDEVTLNASTTGQFLTNCFNPGTFTSWDLFQANTVIDNASITFAVSTGTTCNTVTRSTANWVSQTNNALISIDTAPYLGVRATITSISTGVYQLPKLQDVTIGFKSGADRPPAASVVYDNRYWISFTTNTNSGSANDTVLVVDSQDRFSLFKGIGASSLWLFKRQLYSGSSAQDGKVYKQDIGYTDNGSNINFVMRSPDYDLGAPMADKTLHDLWVEAKPTPDPTATSNVQVNYYVDRGTTPYTLGTFSLINNKNLIWSRHNFQYNSQPIQPKTISIEYADSSAAPITIYRSLIRYQTLPMP